MKTPLLILGTAGLALSLNAQTDPSVPAANAAAAAAVPTAAIQTNSPAQESSEMVITSDRWKCFYSKTNIIMVYAGNVRVKDPQMTLTCDIITAHISQSNGTNKIDSIVAETNVTVEATLQQQDRQINATCAKAIYENVNANSVTNGTLLLIGDPVVRSSDGSSLVSDPILINLTTGEITATNRITTIINLPDDIKGRMKLPAPGTPEKKQTP